MPWTQHCHKLVAVAVVAGAADAVVAAGYRIHCCFEMEDTGYSSCCYCCCYCCLLLYLDMMDSTNYNARIALFDGKVIRKKRRLVAKHC